MTKSAVETNNYQTQGQQQKERQRLTREENCTEWIIIIWNKEGIQKIHIHNKRENNNPDKISLPARFDPISLPVVPTNKDKFIYYVCQFEERYHHDYDDSYDDYTELSSSIVDVDVIVV